MVLVGNRFGFFDFCDLLRVSLIRRRFFGIYRVLCGIRSGILLGSLGFYFLDSALVCLPCSMGFFFHSTGFFLYSFVRLSID